MKFACFHSIGFLHDQVFFHTFILALMLMLCKVNNEKHVRAALNVKKAQRAISMIFSQLLYAPAGVVLRARNLFLIPLP